MVYQIRRGEREREMGEAGRKPGGRRDMWVRFLSSDCPPPNVLSPGGWGWGRRQSARYNCPGASDGACLLALISLSFRVNIR